MKIVSASIVALAIASLAACSAGNQKKVVVMASGTLNVADKQVTLDPGLTHNEKEMVFTTAEPVTISVKSGSDTKNFDVKDDGVYLLNLQTDTLIGSLVNYGETGNTEVITNDKLNHIIDSTVQLMNGTGASDEKKTFFIPPMTIKKISPDKNAKLVGSYKGIPYKVSADESGKIPDVFKFFTNKQKRETLRDLEAQREKIQKLQQ
jgi:hypothetical protein